MKQDIHDIHPDPLGLRDLPFLEPAGDGWPGVRQALEADRQRAARRRAVTGWMAAAASIVLAVVVTTRLSQPRAGDPPGGVPAGATVSEQTASSEDGQTIESLIALSSTLESRLRVLREGAASMPASSAVYVAELEDLVAQVDDRLSQAPGSVDLWGQRVNLLLDLAQIYQHQWELEYGQMASL